MTSETQKQKTPTFAVVGHVNRGKSSIVATLAEDETVRIEKDPGTTRECRLFRMEVDGTPLFSLIDTPGFEQARHVLKWLTDHESSTVNRPEAVREFVSEHKNQNSYPEECKLLKPVLDGAGILYVVDGSRPFSPQYEAEMEILQWTGQPRMALINSIGEEDHVDDWKAALDQYFSLVREFNAHDSGFRERIRLLKAFRELREDWREPMDRAINVLESEWNRRRRESAREITDMIVESLTLKEEKRISFEDDPDDYKAELRKTFLDRLRKLEKTCRDRVEDLFQHSRLHREEQDLELIEEDLFAESTWLRLGLTRRQLATTGAIGGAVIGGAVDAALLGKSFLVGTLIGGAVGAVSGWFTTDSIAQTKVLGQSMGGKKLQAGPVKNRQFPWILLDRALLHYRITANRPHAKQEEAKLKHSDDPESRGVVRDLDRNRRKTLESAFNTLRKNSGRSAIESAKDDIAGELVDILQTLEN